MKKLLLIRHAQTEDLAKGKDINRSLTARGSLDCELMSERLIKQNFFPDCIILSPAMRTQQTSTKLLNHLGLNSINKVVCNGLYQASASFILDEISLVNSKVNSLVIIGHNPGISELLNFMGNKILLGLPTCGMALLNFETEYWTDLLTLKGELIWLNWPSMPE